MSHDDAPSFVLPRIPGTTLVALFGGVLILAMLASAAITWWLGGLEERLGEDGGDAATEAGAR